MTSQDTVIPPNSRFTPIAPGLIRFSATAVFSLVWAQALGGPLAAIAASPSPAAHWALPLTLGALAIAAVAAVTCRRSTRPGPAVATAGLLAASIGLLVPGTGWAAMALVIVAPAAAVLSAAIGRRLPVDVGTMVSRHRARALLWAGIALVAVVQIARLSTWISDPESDWFLTTRHPFWAKHECLPAYVYGAELGLRGEDNLYAAAHYPGLNPDAQPDTAMADMVVEDPFQYTPPFLLLPAAAVTLTHDYPLVRGLWFAIQTSGFLAFAALLGVWIGGPVGRLSLWLLPLALSAFPLLHNLQYGQFHLAAVALGLGGMLALDRGRRGHRGYLAAGGSMLALATLSKVFPGILLLVLASQRRFRELAWTAGAAAALCLLTLAVFGSAPLEAFVGYHVPRLQSGAAFAFGDAWPEMRDFVITANHGVFGSIVKLGEVGVPGLDRGVATQVNRVFSVLLALGAWLAGSRLSGADRAQRAVAWLSLLGLASMMSTGAFADYVPLTATWLLTLLAGRMTRPATALALGVVWVFQYTLLFVAPLGDWFDRDFFLPMSTASTLMMLGLFAWSLAQSLREARTQPVRATRAAAAHADRVSGSRLSEA